MPFPYFYDVTALEPAAALRRRRRLLGRAAGDGDGGGRPGGRARPCRRRRATARRSRCTPCRRTFTRGIESSGWLRWLLDRWGLDYDDVSAARHRGRRARRPRGPARARRLRRRATCRSRATRTRSRTSGPAGQAAIRDWVQGGGRYVGWLDGAVLAAAVGISSAQLTDAGDAGISSPGALIRAVSAGRQPAARRRRAVAADVLGLALRGAGAGRRSCRCATRPRSSADFFVSGYADGRGGARRHGGDRRRAGRRGPHGGLRLRAELPRVHRRHADAAAQRDPRRRPGARRPRGSPPCARPARGRRRGGPRGGCARPAARSGSSCGARTRARRGGGPARRGPARPRRCAAAAA